VLREAAHTLLWLKRHVSGELRVPELPCLLPFLQPDDVFFDVGAHAGAWAVPVSKIVRGGHVYAFEAFPYYARLLENVVTLLRRTNVTVIVGAVSDKPGQTSIVWKDADGHRLTGKTHMSATADADVSVPVPTLTIDGFYAPLAPRRVRLIKCDVEGAELLVFRGAEQTIAKWRPIVFCEINAEFCLRYGHRMEDVFAFFAARSYATFTAHHGRLRPLEPAEYSGLGDVVFVPSEVSIPTTCA
jgi:FkbM family methyltransferase